MRAETGAKLMPLYRSVAIPPGAPRAGPARAWAPAPAPGAPGARAAGRAARRGRRGGRGRRPSRAALGRAGRPAPGAGGGPGRGLAANQALRFGGVRRTRGGGRGFPRRAVIPPLTPFVTSRPPPRPARSTGPRGPLSQCPGPTWGRVLRAVQASGGPRGPLRPLTGADRGPRTPAVQACGETLCTPARLLLAPYGGLYLLALSQVRSGWETGFGSR